MTEIVRGVLIQQRIQELDGDRLWERHLPAVAAGEDEIAGAERRLGFALDSQYRQFLRFANGWRRFYQAVDLFGTPNLLGGSPMDAAVAMLGAVERDDFEAAVGMSPSEVLPIAASTVQPDVFLLAQPWSPAPGAVIWYAGELIEQFPSFEEYFLAMLDYNREEIRYLEQGDAG